MVFTWPIKQKTEIFCRCDAVKIYFQAVFFYSTTDSLWTKDITWWWFAKMLQLCLKHFYRCLGSNFMLFDLLTSYLSLPATFLGLLWFSFLQQKAYYNDNNNFYASGIKTVADKVKLLYLGKLFFASIGMVVCIHHTSSILVSSYKEKEHPFTCFQYPKSDKKISAKVNPSSCPQLY